MGAKALVSADPVGPRFVAKTPVLMAKAEGYMRGWEEEMRKSLRRDAVDPDALVDEIRAAKSRGDLAYFEMAVKLVALKRLCNHGNFTQRLADLQIHPRIAQLAMASAIRILGEDLQGAGRMALIAVGPSKLTELMTLADGDLDEIINGAEIGGITLDKIDKMSVRELREKIRKLEKYCEEINADAYQQTAINKDVRIENQRLRRQWSSRPVDERVLTRMADVTTFVRGIEGSLGDYGSTRAKAGLAGALQALIDECEGDKDDKRGIGTLHMTAELDRLQLAVRALRDSYVV